MDLVFKALADATRRRLLDLLHARNGETLSELGEGLATSRQAVSKHPARLEDASLVATVRRGREKSHCLNPCRSTRSPSAGSAPSSVAACRRSPN